MRRFFSHMTIVLIGLLTISCSNQNTRVTPSPSVPLVAVDNTPTLILTPTKQPTPTPTSTPSFTPLPPTPTHTSTPTPTLRAANSESEIILTELPPEVSNFIEDYTLLTTQAPASVTEQTLENGLLRIEFSTGLEISFTLNTETGQFQPVVDTLEATIQRGQNFLNSGYLLYMEDDYPGIFAKNGEKIEVDDVRVQDVTIEDSRFFYPEMRTFPPIFLGSYVKDNKLIGVMGAVDQSSEPTPFLIAMTFGFLDEQAYPLLSKVSLRVRLSDSPTVGTFTPRGLGLVTNRFLQSALLQMIGRPVFIEIFSVIATGEGNLSDEIQQVLEYTNPQNIADITKAFSGNGVESVFIIGPNENIEEELTYLEVPPLVSNLDVGLPPE